MILNEKMCNKGRLNRSVMSLSLEELLDFCTELCQWVETNKYVSRQFHVIRVSDAMMARCNWPRNVPDLNFKFTKLERLGRKMAAF